MPAFYRRRLLSADSAGDGVLKAAVKSSGAMRADSSRSSDSTAGDGGDGGGLAAHERKAGPAGRSRRSSFQHSGSDDDPTVLMCGCLGPTGAATLLHALFPCTVPCATCWPNGISEATSMLVPSERGCVTSADAPHCCEGILRGFTLPIVEAKILLCPACPPSRVRLFGQTR